MLAAKTSALPILYSFRRCPYAMRARLALDVAAIAVEHREILLRDKPPTMLAISAKGTVPVLQLPDGSVIDESIDVARWALAQNDPEGWLSADLHATDQLVAACDGPFKTALDHYKYHVRFPERSQADYFEDAKVFLDGLEARLYEHAGAALLGEQSSLVDYALLPFIRQFAHVDMARFVASGRPLLQAWLQRFLDSDRFARVMIKHPVWLGS